MARRSSVSATPQSMHCVVNKMWMACCQKLRSVGKVLEQLNRREKYAVLSEGKQKFICIECNNKYDDKDVEILLGKEKHIVPAVADPPANEKEHVSEDNKNEEIKADGVCGNCMKHKRIVLKLEECKHMCCEECMRCRIRHLCKLHETKSSAEVYCGSCQQHRRVSKSRPHLYPVGAMYLENCDKLWDVETLRKELSDVLANPSVSPVCSHCKHLLTERDFSVLFGEKGVAAFKTRKSAKLAPKNALAAVVEEEEAKSCDCVACSEKGLPRLILGCKHAICCKCCPNKDRKLAPEYQNIRFVQLYCKKCGTLKPIGMLTRCHICIRKDNADVLRWENTQRCDDGEGACVEDCLSHAEGNGRSGVRILQEANALRAGQTTARQ